jgi:hypothetical protein
LSAFIKIARATASLSNCFIRSSSTIILGSNLKKVISRILVLRALTSAGSDEASSKGMLDVIIIDPRRLPTLTFALSYFCSVERKCPSNKFQKSGKCIPNCFQRKSSKMRIYGISSSFLSLARLNLERDLEIVSILLEPTSDFNF